MIAGLSPQLAKELDVPHLSVSAPSVVSTPPPAWFDDNDRLPLEEVDPADETVSTGPQGDAP
jgi:hypothetical protein